MRALFSLIVGLIMCVTAFFTKDTNYLIVAWLCFIHAELIDRD